MKKAMWIISVLNLGITAVVLQFLPESVPMHFNVAGAVDRWGSKYENLLLPAIVLALSLFLHLIIFLFEKKAAGASTDKEKAAARSNTKVIKIIGVSIVSMFTVLQGFLLYNAYVGGSQSSFNFGKITCILCGILFVVLGNFMPKLKRNYLLGFRIKWSMYNDTTWMKSNRFAAIAMVAAGIATILSSLFANESLVIILTLAYLMIAALVSTVYAYTVYKQELGKEEKAE